MAAPMEQHFWNSLRTALNRKADGLTFNDNSYYSEEFIEESIQADFAGWYEEETIVNQIDLILKCCELQTHATVLDVSCGHGKHSELLYQKGYNVTGTDISPVLIDYLSRKHTSKIHFEKKAFEELDYVNAFDLIIVLGNSLSLIPVESFQLALPKLRDALKENGRLFLEFEHRSDYIKQYAGKRQWNYYCNRWLVLSDHYYDITHKLEKTIDTGLDLEKMSIDQFCITKRLYNWEELSELLEAVGLVVEQSFGDWDGNPIDENSPSLLVVAKK